MQWSRAGLEHAVAFLDRIYALVSSCRGIDFAAVIDPARQAAPKLSRAARALRGTTDRMLVRVAEFIEEFRPHAALAELSRATGRIERFATNRVGKGRLDPREARILGSVLNDHILALAPFAPHLAEECWQMLGNQELACRQRWPTSPPVSH
jgi:leucyl-tRNA synthetase